MKEHGIECQMTESGKYQAAVGEKGVAILEAYRSGLEKIGRHAEMIPGKDLPDHIGTSYYQQALYIPGTILLQPSALVKGLADNLPSNVTLYENTPHHLHRLWRQSDASACSGHHYRRHADSGE
ncbi:FAD dependent oxidoreductase [Leclercia adecarboxylata]|uniref:FAD dependent oxidoreductase n=1 Tax=Leclercia adecarboxylata TaxID=83655 RepID=A0A4U9HKP6_9ENTR|nr:FAD dependent oxidoreductase [Leclercia adecarboxylata]